MIDIHTHILPGIDDGAADWDMSIKMARAAAAEGITDLIATPHHANGKYDNDAESINRLVEELQGRLEAEGIPIKIHAGQEIRVHTTMLDAWEAKELLTLAQSKYVLLEMPSSSIPSSMSEWIHEFKIMGIQPIIAHPERNAEVVQHPERYQALIQQGAYGQVTTHSLLGAFGKKIEQTAWNLCSQGLIHFVSSDAHNLEWRGFRLQEAYYKMSQKLGPKCDEIFRNNADIILSGGVIEEFKSSMNLGTSKWELFRKLLGKR